MTTNPITMRYFVYSAAEEERKIRLLKDRARFGTVLVRGVPKRYTSIVRDPSETSPDSIVLVKGDIRKIKYTAP